MPEISIIVPVYKVEKYIHRCIDSILAQTFTDFELILVDDGNPDSCGAICDEYAEKDGRIRVIHQKNSGVSAARNSGVSEACGKYVCFVDSDDWIRADYLQKLYTYSLIYNADISFLKIQYVFNAKTKEPSIIEEIKTYNQEESLSYICTERGNQLKNVVGKLVLTDIVRRFPFPTDRCYAEDMAVFYRWVACANRIVVSNLEKYCYYQNPDSVSHESYSKKRLGNLMTLNEMRDFFMVNKFHGLYKAFTLSYAIDLCSQYKNLIAVLNDWETAEKLKEELKYIIRTERKRCGITLKTAPQCYELLYPRCMYVYWLFVSLKNKLFQNNKRGSR